MPKIQAALLLTVLAFTFSNTVQAQSTCYGQVDNGRIENAVRLPRNSANFVRMAQGPMSNERVFVHSLVHDILLDAYASLATERPKIRWVYGETGLEQGGPIPPHQTHQNGLSVDLFVPTVDKDGNSVQFPNRPGNGYGYQVTFNASGENSTHNIDFANLGELLYHLHMAAKNLRQWAVVGCFPEGITLSSVRNCARKVAEGEYTVSELG